MKLSLGLDDHLLRPDLLNYLIKLLPKPLNQELLETISRPRTGHPQPLTLLALRRQKLRKLGTRSIEPTVGAMVGVVVADDGVARHAADRAESVRLFGFAGVAGYVLAFLVFLRVR